LPVDKGWLARRVAVIMSGVNVARRHHLSADADQVGHESRGRSRPAVAPESPPATRAPQRTWKDPRLVVGIALVAACVLVGARLLATADDTVAVWAARGALTEGASLTATDLRRESLRFGSSGLAERYVSADSPPPDGMVLTREVAAGELLPRAALGPAERVDLAEIPIAVPAEAVPTTLRAGEVVDVWVTPADARSGTGAVPRASLVLGQVRVLAVPQGGSALGPSVTRQVLIGLPVAEQGRLAGALTQLSAGTPVIVRRD
jgi:hypothetical protein